MTVDERDPTTWRSGVLADWQIKSLSIQPDGMIEPFEPKPVREVACLPGAWIPTAPMRAPAPLPPTTRKVISYGLSSYGYDIRVAGEFKVFTPTSCEPVDPKAMPEKAFDTIVTNGSVLIPPNSFALARTIERFNIPREVIALVYGKSTYARCGIVVNCTPLEPEWRGHLTMEISNTTPLPARIYANEGIAQLVFHWTSAKCHRSYADKNDGRPGKYQSQGPEIVLPKV